MKLNQNSVISQKKKSDIKGLTGESYYLASLNWLHPPRSMQQFGELRSM